MLGFRAGLHIVAQSTAMSTTVYDANVDGIVDLLVALNFAGNPNGNVTAVFVGQECHDTLNDKIYEAHALGDANWQVSSEAP